MMGKRRQRLRLVGLALAVALVAAGCGRGEEGGQAGPKQAAQRGGVFRTATTDFGLTNGLDVTGEYVGSAFALYSALVRTLVSYRFVAGDEGNKLYPDLATEVPQPTDNGLTYTYKLKPNIRFSPPVNRAVTSKTSPTPSSASTPRRWLPSTASTTTTSSRGWTARPRAPTPRSPASRRPTTRRSSST
jgi:ABC-type transport system substrate-binding protein